MLRQANIIAFIFTVAAVTIPAGTHAYQIDTHAFLSDETFDFYNSRFERKIPEEFRAFFIDGSRREDDAPRWMNHFYDPVHKRGLSYDPSISPTAAIGNWQASKFWAEDRENQNKPTYKIPTAIASILTAIQRMSISDITTKTDFTWQEAIRHYANGDMEKAFFTLGHVIHLVQDASVPAHARNDVHPEGDPYETFAGGYVLSNPDMELETRLGSKMPELRGSLEEYFEELATYTNNHFYSEDTIGIQTGYSKPEPDLSNFEIENGLFYLKSKDTNRNDYLLITKKSLKNLLVDNTQNTKLDDRVRGSYWSLLSTKAVQYGAGVIDLFFKEAEKAKSDPNFDRGEKKSFLGKFMDALKFGVQEIGSVVGSVFTSDVSGGPDSIAQNPPRAPDVGDEEDDGSEDETELSAGDEEEYFDEYDFSDEEYGNQNKEEVFLEEDPGESDEIEEEIVSEDEQKTPAPAGFLLCAFDDRKRTEERTVVLNEVAWMGTEDGYTKEWFELKNISKRDISLSGWQILDYDNEIKIKLSESAVILPGEFFLFERGNDDSVPGEAADVIYKGNLSNDGTKKTEGLRLFDGECTLHDEVYAAPWWPAGNNKEKRTMERDRDAIGWHTSSVSGGTPKKENSERYASSVSGGGSSAPTAEYASVKITEIFYDASGTDDGREWIELKNEDTKTVDVGEWKFSEGGTNHGLSRERGSVSLSPGDFAVIADDAQTFLSENPSFSGNLFDSSFSLSNDGETVEIRNGTLVIDSVLYASSTGARGDGNSLQKISGGWEAAPPTPGLENVPLNYPPEAVFSVTPSEPVASDFVYFESLSSDPDGTIVNLYWEFGDGMATSGTSSVVTHMYGDEGFYSAILTATDDEGAIASSSRTIFVASSSSVTSPATHVVISEILFDAEGSDEGKEFVEFYNPLGVDVDLTAWSLAYFIGNSTTSIPIATFGSMPEDNLGIETKKFFLVGVNGYDPANFGGIEADAVRSKNLPNGSEWISVALFDSAGTEIDRMRYTGQSIQQEGRSVERKTVVQNTCTSARGNHEYSGHTCDRGSDGDFEEREIPNPQNSLNLKEPRGRLSAPVAVSGEPSVGTFIKDSMEIVFSWTGSTSTDEVGEVAYRMFDMSAGTVEFVWTTSTTSSVAITEVGRTYSFEIYAEDAEGYRSEKTEFTVSVPGFFDGLYAYPDPRTENGTYLLDMYWDEFPFVPENKGGSGWQAVVFYKNRSPNENNKILSSSDGYAIPDGDGVLPVLFESCAAGVLGTDEDLFILPLGSGWCSSQGGDLYPRAFDWSRLEDFHAIIYTDEIGAGDYISVAYYDRNGSGHFELVATDKAKWFAQAEKPLQRVPELSGDIGIEFNGSESKITLSLPSASDSDSIDSELVYEINFSPNATSALDEALWNATTTTDEYIKAVAPGDAYLIGVRARDDFGNLSGVATTTWEYPSTQFPVSQTAADGWGAPLGTTQFTANEADTASFQSLSPSESFSFDSVVVRLKQETASDVATLRLSVLGSAGTTTPDFSNVLAETTLGNLINPSPDEEKTFLFASPVNVVSGNMYWLVLDAAEYSDIRGHMRNEWKNAVMSGGSAYAEGIAGSGHYRGRNAACGGEVVCDFTPNSAADWYMKIGTRE